MDQEWKRKDQDGNLGHVDRRATTAVAERNPDLDDESELTNGPTPGQIQAEDETRAPEEEGGDLHESNG